VIAAAAVHGDTVAYWIDGGLFLFGAVLAALLFRRRPWPAAAGATAPARDLDAAPALAG
jgi:hypothetical protein